MTSQGPHDMHEEPRVVVISHATSDGVASLAGLFAHPMIRVVACGNGVEVVARARELRPALIVIDTALPGMDGFEVFRALRNELDALKTKMIFVSDRTEQGALALARDCGVHACFRAPYSPGRLRDRVLETLHLPAEPRSTKSRPSAPTPPPISMPSPTPAPPPAPRLPIPTPAPMQLPPGGFPLPAPSKPGTARGSARVPQVPSPAPAPLPVPAPAASAPPPLPVPVRAAEAAQPQASALPPTPVLGMPAVTPPPAKKEEKEMVSPVPLLKVRPRP